MSALAANWPGSPARSTHRLEHLAGGLLIDVGLGCLLALLPWLYFWRLFAPNRADQMTVADGDFMGNTFPLLLTVARSLRAGELPLWNPLSGGGQPLWAHPQAGVLYPLNWPLFAALQAPDAQSLLATERIIGIHIALASLGTYLLARILIGSRAGSFVAALTFGYSGFLTSYPVQQLPVLRSAAWFPLQVLAWWLTLERRSILWSALTGILIALALLAGHPQTVFIESLGLVVIAGARGAIHITSEGRLRGVFHTCLLTGLAALIAAGLSAAQWIPTRELQTLSSRTEEGYNFVAGGFSLWEIPLDLIAPGVLGGLPPYVGIFPLVVAAAGMILRPSRLHAMLISLTVVGVLLSLGGQTFLYPSLYVMFPAFDLFRNQERAIMLFTLAVALLAGVGAESVLGSLDLHAKGRLLRYRRTLGFLLLIALGAGGALYVGHINAEVANQGFRRWRDVVHAFFFFIFVLACAWGLISARLTLPSLRPALPILMVVLVAFDLFTVTADRQFVLRPADSAFNRPVVVDRIWNEIDYGKMADRNILAGNHGLSYELASVTSTFPLRLARFDTARASIPETRFFDLLNVTHVITQRDDPLLKDPGSTETLPDAGYVLFRRSSAPGPAYVVPEAHRVATADEALRAVAASEFNLRSQVIIEGPPDAALPRGGPATIAEFRKGWADATVRAAAPNGGYLVLSDVAYAGWHAYVDGAEQPILRANYLVQAVQLSPGEHLVTFRYEPDSVRFGMIISGITLLAVALLALWTVITAGNPRGRLPRA